MARATFSETLVPLILALPTNNAAVRVGVDGDGATAGRAAPVKTSRRGPRAWMELPGRSVETSRA